MSGIPYLFYRNLRTIGIGSILMACSIVTPIRTEAQDPTALEDIDPLVAEEILVRAAVCSSEIERELTAEEKTRIKDAVDKWKKYVDGEYEKIDEDNKPPPNETEEQKAKRLEKIKELQKQLNKELKKYFKFLHSPNCGPSAEAERLYALLPDKYKGTAIDCSQTPKPQECNESRAVVPSIIITIPLQEPKTIKMKPDVKYAIEELKKPIKK